MIDVRQKLNFELALRSTLRRKVIMSLKEIAMKAAAAALTNELCIRVMPVEVVDGQMVFKCGNCFVSEQLLRGAGVKDIVKDGEEMIFRV